MVGKTSGSGATMISESLPGRPKPALHGEALLETDLVNVLGKS